MHRAVVIFAFVLAVIPSQGYGIQISPGGLAPEAGYGIQISPGGLAPETGYGIQISSFLIRCLDLKTGGR